DPLVDQQLRTGWRLVRVDSILRAILRAGVFELLERSDVPARVTINEYINIAKAFFEGEEPKVVNGVLDRIAHKVRAKEFEAAGEGGSAVAADEEGGEDELIQTTFAPLASGFSGALGLRDDCAVLTPPPGEDLVLTTDAVAEGVHFFPDDAATD